MKQSPQLIDAGSERVVLAGILNNGANGLVEIEELLGTSDFYFKHNQNLFYVLKDLAHNHNAQEFDIPTILAHANILRCQLSPNNKDEEWLSSLFSEQPSLDNTLEMAACVYKLCLARRALECIQSVANDISTVCGTESILDIINRIEDPIFDFTSKIYTDKSDITLLGHGCVTFLNKLLTHPKDIAGIPTGFPNYDYCIGGGAMPATVNVISGRPKHGKSVIVLNMAHNIAAQGIPVLILDTELPREMQECRSLALMTGVEINRIKTGNFAGAPEDRDKVIEAAKKLESLPITHCSIAGQKVSNAISIARRWLNRVVGINSNGLVKPCVIFYDYIKIMNSDDIKHNLAEYQVLGFVLTELHNFALKYKIPFIATAQVNRTGIDKDTSEGVAGSDRILWLCSSMARLRRKDTETANIDPMSEGTHCLTITEARDGPGMTTDGQYINIQAKLSCGQMKEGKIFDMSNVVIPINKKKHNKVVEDTDEVV